MNPLRGSEGHPSHPPLTDAAIGMYTLAAGMAIVGAVGWIEDASGKAMWLAQLGGLIAGVFAALTGVLDWLHITRDTTLWRAATAHGAVMATATLLFVVATIFQYDGFHEGRVVTTSLVLTLVGYAVLVLGGWLGGTLTYVHGMRVVGESDTPVVEAIDPRPKEHSSAS